MKNFVLKYCPVLLVLIGVLLLIGAGWRLHATKARADQQAAEIVQLNQQISDADKLRKAETQLRGLRATVDQAFYEDYKRVKDKNTDYQLKLSSGAKRVYVPISNCAPVAMSDGRPAAGVDDGAQTAELDPSFAAAMAGITTDGDDAIGQLTALQEWVEAKLKQNTGHDN